MYTVYDNDKKAQYPDCNVHPSWNNASFNCFKDAEYYANEWIHLSEYIFLTLNQPYDYNGYGDLIEIRKE